MNFIKYNTKKNNYFNVNYCECDQLRLNYLIRLSSVISLVTPPSLSEQYNIRFHNI